MRLSVTVAPILALAIAFAGLAGCGKGQPPALPPATANGTTVDVGTISRSLASSTSPQVKQALADFVMMMRYSQPDKAAADLDKIAADSSLTDDQKKVVSDTQEQVKRMIAAGGK